MIERLGHFKVYEVSRPEEARVSCRVRGQFDGRRFLEVSLVGVTHFANPVAKRHDRKDREGQSEGNRNSIPDDTAHFVWYEIDQEDEPRRTVWFINQFRPGRPTRRPYQRWLLDPPSHLLVPAKKGEHSFPELLDHYKAYPVADVIGADAEATLTLEDQFDEPPGESVALDGGRYFCAPVSKVTSAERCPILRRDAHLAVYGLSPEVECDHRIHATDQFFERELNLTKRSTLSAPSRKLEWEVEGEEI